MSIEKMIQRGVLRSNNMFKRLVIMNETP